MLVYLQGARICPSVACDLGYTPWPCVARELPGGSLASISAHHFCLLAALVHARSSYTPALAAAPIRTSLAIYVAGGCPLLVASRQACSCKPPSLAELVKASFTLLSRQADACCC